MNSTDSHTADEFLDLSVEAARRQFDDAQIEQAAQRLREKLPRARAGRRNTMRWLTLTAAASIVLAAVTAASLFLPGRPGSAFAQAQQWFSSFSTLHIETTAQVGQENVSQTDLWLNDSGDLRIEAAGVTTIVKADTDTIYILMPDGQTVAQSIPPNAATDDTADWLDEIRYFQGAADLLAESRLIDGITATGYELPVNSTTLVLWVDPFDGRPLLVEAESPGGTSVRHALTFDAPLPAGAFEVPDVQP